MKKYKTKEDARVAIKAGVDKVADAVKLTLGPGGTNAIIGRPFQNPLVTNDGITIAKEFMVEDEIEQLGVGIIQDVLKSANGVVGDGSTTTTVLTQAILNEAFRRIDPKNFTKTDSPMGLREKIFSECETVVSELKKLAKEITTKEEISDVATISVESRKLGDLIGEMFFTLGKDSLITVQDGFNRQIETDTTVGTDTEGGLMNDYFSNTEKKEYVEEQPFIWVTNKPISSVTDLESMIDLSVKGGKKSMIIVAEHFDKLILDLMLHNKMSGVFSIIPIKVPTSNKSYILTDLALMLEAQFIDKEVETELKPGTCKKIIVTNGRAIFLGTDGKVEKLVKELKEEETKLDSLYDKEKIRTRIQKLSGGIGVIRVDAETQTEKEYLKLKIEDAINATRCALEEGVVVGGGLALKQISDSIKLDVLSEAIKAPYKQIQENAGGVEIGDKVTDPVKVTRTSLEKACSIAGMIITTNIAIADKLEEPKDFKQE